MVSVPTCSKEIIFALLKFRNLERRSSYWHTWSITDHFQRFVPLKTVLTLLWLMSFLQGLDIPFLFMVLNELYCTCLNWCCISYFSLSGLILSGTLGCIAVETILIIIRIDIFVLPFLFSFFVFPYRANWSGSFCKPIRFSSPSGMPRQWKMTTLHVL